MIARRWGFAVAAIIGASVLGAAPAHADESVSGCQSDNWGFLGLTQKRVICDGPIHADGSWNRVRLIIVPAHHVYAHSSCSDYSCTYYPADDVDTEVDQSDAYPVNDGNIVGGEPGHLVNNMRYTG